jgi:hypothetical protein
MSKVIRTDRPDISAATQIAFARRDRAGTRNANTRDASRRLVIASEPGGDRLACRIDVAANLAVLPDPRLESFLPLENRAHVTCIFAP